MSREWRCHLNRGVPMEKFFCKVFEGENLGTGVFHNGGGSIIKRYENLVKTNIDKL